MKDLGVQKGEMVALNGPNSPEYLMLWFALEAVGARVSYVNWNLTGTALAHSIKVSVFLLLVRGMWRAMKLLMSVSDSCVSRDMCWQTERQRTS